MQVTYQFINTDLTKNCSICLNPLDKEVVAHTGEGNKHPAHIECLTPWVKVNPSCPYCRVNIDPTLPLSLKERVVEYIGPYSLFVMTVYVIAISAVVFTGLRYDYSQQQDSVPDFRWLASHLVSNLANHIVPDNETLMMISIAAVMSTVIDYSVQQNTVRDFSWIASTFGKHLIRSTAILMTSNIFNLWTQNVRQENL